MRAVLWFFAVIFGTLLLAALLAWPAWLAAHALEPGWPFHRVVGRLWQLLLLGGLVLACRKLGLTRRADWGYGLPPAQFVRQAGAGLAAGVATMLPMTLAMLALGVLRLDSGFAPGVLAAALAAGLLTGLAVALVEETFFRGAMYGGVAREAGARVAAWSTALLYSAVHFLARARIPADEVATDSGLRLLAGALAHFADPLPVLDSFVTLVLVGLLLAWVRQRTGSIAAGVGLHMGWVGVIKATGAVTRVDESAPSSFLVGSFDGYTGWLVAGWAALLMTLARRRGWPAPPREPAR